MCVLKRFLVRPSGAREQIRLVWHHGSRESIYLHILRLCDLTKTWLFHCSILQFINVHCLSSLCGINTARWLHCTGPCLRAHRCATIVFLLPGVRHRSKYRSVQQRELIGSRVVCVFPFFTTPRLDQTPKQPLGRKASVHVQERWYGEII